MWSFWPIFTSFVHTYIYQITLILIFLLFVSPLTRPLHHLFLHFFFFHFCIPTKSLIFASIDISTNEINLLLTKKKKEIKRNSCKATKNKERERQGGSENRERKVESEWVLRVPFNVILTGQNIGTNAWVFFFLVFSYIFAEISK